MGVHRQHLHVEAPSAVSPSASLAGTAVRRSRRLIGRRPSSSVDDPLGVLADGGDVAEHPLRWRVVGHRLELLLPIDLPELGNKALDDNPHTDDHGHNDQHPLHRPPASTADPRVGRAIGPAGQTRIRARPQADRGRVRSAWVGQETPAARGHSASEVPASGSGAGTACAGQMAVADRGHQPEHAHGAHQDAQAGAARGDERLDSGDQRDQANQRGDGQVGLVAMDQLIEVGHHRARRSSEPKCEDDQPGRPRAAHARRRRPGEPQRCRTRQRRQPGPSRSGLASGGASPLPSVPPVSEATCTVRLSTQVRPGSQHPST